MLVYRFLVNLFKMFNMKLPHANKALNELRKALKLRTAFPPIETYWFWDCGQKALKTILGTNITLFYCNCNKYDSSSLRSYLFKCMLQNQILKCMGYF